MGTEPHARRYGAWYAMLLRLYPRPFRERFGEGMAQTFQDLCREQRNAGRPLYALALRTFFETFIGAIREHTVVMPDMGKTLLRVALFALCLLMAPLAASRVVDGWNWPPKAFVLVYVLFFVTGLAFVLIARKFDAWSYKAGVGLALAAGFALGWSNMVHVADSENPRNLIYYVVLVVGACGAWLARLEARGLARTLFAMAVLLAAIAVLLPSGAPPVLARNMAIGHGVLVMLFALSGMLFRRASSR